MFEHRVGRPRLRWVSFKGRSRSCTGVLAYTEQIVSMHASSRSFWYPPETAIGILADMERTLELA